MAPEAKPYYTLAFAYEDLDGSAEFTQFKDLDLAQIKALTTDAS